MALARGFTTEYNRFDLSWPSGLDLACAEQAQQQGKTTIQLLLELLEDALSRPEAPLQGLAWRSRELGHSFMLPYELERRLLERATALGLELGQLIALLAADGLARLSVDLHAADRRAGERSGFIEPQSFPLGPRQRPSSLAERVLTS